MSQIKNIIRVGDSLLGKTVDRIEPQKVYMFEVSFFDINSYIPSFGELRYNVKSITIPAFSKEVIKRNFLNSRITYGGRNSSENMVQITFWENEGLDILDYIHKWYSLSGDLEFGDGLSKKDYIKNIRVYLKDSSDALITGSFLFKNAFPTEISDLVMTYDDSAPAEITVSFNYDFVYFDDAINANKEKVDSIAKTLNYEGSITDSTENKLREFFN